MLRESDPLETLAQGEIEKAFWKERVIYGFWVANTPRNARNMDGTTGLVSELVIQGRK